MPLRRQHRLEHLGPRGALLGGVEGRALRHLQERAVDVSVVPSQSDGELSLIR